MIETEGITCLDCGERFVRARGYVGEYCDDCHDGGDRDAE